ncbi:PilZ domain-containing protein [Thauera aromatica]|uniref:PilZ domain-containing protein n=1 Tax=Thauera aromatica TaxID=59405 RepID=UPI001FFCD2F3|nr:PilZ domain-containing protein [Thauera aromatica]MCK2088977.1 PilZ domain-containing protein [Thauera aromatica]
MKQKSAPFCKRAHPRVQARMPVHIAALEGITRDVSAGGVYFELEGDTEMDNEICFELELETTLGSLCMQCSGEVVRRERRSSRTGVAVRMTDSYLSAAL